MRSALRDDGAPDRRAALGAGKPFTAVNTVPQLKAAFAAFGVDIVRHGRPAMQYRLFKNFLYSHQQARGADAAQIARAWPYAGAEQGLIGVDVSDPTQHALIQQ